MRRRLLNLMTALSLLLFVAACVLWLRSRSTSDWLGVGRTVVASMDGRLSLAVPYGAMSSEPQGRFFRFVGDGERLAFGLILFGRQPAVKWEAAGFEYRHAAVTGGGVRLYVLPWWAIALGFAVAPGGSAIRAWRRRHPLRPGLCPRCGYDLTGNVSGVCPECGTSDDANSRRSTIRGGRDG